MGLAKKVISVLCGTAMAGMIYSARPAVSEAGGARVINRGSNVHSTANIHADNGVVKLPGSYGKVNVYSDNSRIYLQGIAHTVRVEGDNNDMRINGMVEETHNSSPRIIEREQQPSELENKLEGKKILTCDDFNCYYHTVKDGSITSTETIRPELSYISLRIDAAFEGIPERETYISLAREGKLGEVARLGNGEILELEKGQTLRIGDQWLEIPGILKAFHNKGDLDLTNGGENVTVNFKGYDSGSESHDDKGHIIRYSELIRKYRNPDGTWSIIVTERESGAKLGEVYIKYSGPEKRDAPTPSELLGKKAVIWGRPEKEGDPTVPIRVFIDSRASRSESFYTDVLEKASDNLYSNFGIRLGISSDQYVRLPRNPLYKKP